MTPLWDDTLDAPSFDLFPEARRWAKLICQERGWKGLAHSSDGLYKAIGQHLTAVLRRVAGSTQLDQVLAKDPAYLVSMIPRLRCWRRRQARRAVAELSGASKGDDYGGCPFFVNPSSQEDLHRIEIQAGDEILTTDGWRLRPHNFRVRGLKLATGSRTRVRVAQIAERSSANEGQGAIKWDTIFHDNPDSPFWPTAAQRADHRFSHRCSVHQRGDGLEWSDWPQIAIKHEAEVPHEWHFVTGVFEWTEREPTGCYDLIARAEWMIDWSRVGQVDDLPYAN